ncbi:Adenylate cyclase [Cyberlindnera fabianii]|uniref:Adenylate cyclase n=1 Tax=Cyberlindnera fabianii TaxID=36022 RepID=A0A1V2LBT6_CYBFA|nr:Adenylate cyclase [Cyberlindnera fabianii]
MSNFNSGYFLHQRNNRSEGSPSTEGEVSPLTSRKVSLVDPSSSGDKPGGTRTPSLQSSPEAETPQVEGNSVSPQSEPTRTNRLSSVPFSYKGFHHASVPNPIPPLHHPVKPKNKTSLFGKFINSIRDEKRGSKAEHHHHLHHHHHQSPDPSVEPSTKTSFSKPLTQPSHASNIRDQNTISGNSLEVPQSSQLPSSQAMRHNPSFASIRTSVSAAGNDNSVATLDMNDLDMDDIIAEDPSKEDLPSPKVKESWAAPESWDVKEDKKDQKSIDDDEDYVVRRTYTHMSHDTTDLKAHENRQYHIRIHAEDDDFASTLKRPYGETVDELLKFLKGRYQLSGDYKLSLRVGKVTKKLESFQKPVKIQTNLLLLSGYNDDDKLEEIGRFDLSYLFKFILHHDVLKQLSPAEEENISRDLVHVNLKSKDLQKIPALCYSSKVQSLDVSNNGDITLPSDFFQTADSQLSSLRMVNIRTKVFPPNIVYARELVSLDLKRNFIQSIPNNLHMLRNLSILNLSCNRLTDLPKLPSSLKILDLSSNEFEVYPESINKLTSLLQLDLSYNKLKRLPESINNLKSLKKMNISSNYLTHVDINMHSLRTLNLRYNDIFEIHLQGNNLENLYLTHNNISNISDPLPGLRLLDLQQNPITQLNIQSPNLASLNLCKAKLTSLPGFILTLSKLEKLELSKNALRELPDISSLANLRELSMYSNNLEILPDLSALSKLKFLDLHDNNLKSIYDFSVVEDVNLSSNLISEFPDPTDDKTHILRASDNQLDENSFYAIRALKHLRTLDLSYNKLIDIPNNTLGSLVHLEELYMSGNALSSLPDDFDQLTQLRLLTLNGNRFRTLPSDMSNLSNAEVIDVGSNDLKYNTSNSKYEWNWKNNRNLRYLNLSGNKKLEITEDLNLPRLKMLGLMDLTITTQSIPDESMHMRVRTTPTQLAQDLSYGIAETIQGHILARDSVYQKIDGGVLIGIFDGLNGGKISHIIRENFHKVFETELKKDTVTMALRSTFLQLNGIIHHSDLSYEDALVGSSVTVVYLKEKRVYTANIGDTMVMLAKPDGSFTFLTTHHQPSSPVEFDRVRTSGGFVSPNDKVDGVSKVSRAAGFTDLLPHVHTGPDITETTINDDVIVIGTKELFDYLPTKTIGDIVRESDNPMSTAERLRDYAMSYGCTSKVLASVISRKKAKKMSFPVSRQLVEDSNLRRLKPEIRPPVGELAMVFTDIKNSTLLWENYPLAMRSAIRTHNDIMRRQLHIVGGYEVKTEGDAFMVSFPTVTSAMVWCFNVQQQLLLEDWPAEILQSEEGCELKDPNGTVIYKGLSVRMGIHWGTPVCEPDIITRRMDYFGPMVNKTARVCAVADGGEITLTLDCLNEFRRIEKAWKDCRNGIPIEQAFGNGEMSSVLESEFTILKNIGWTTEFMGKVQLKGLETEEEITLVLPKQLETRLQFQRKPDLTSEDIHGIRDIALRLDRILCKLNGNPLHISNVKGSEHVEKQLLEVFISRIEHTVALLLLREQTVGLFDETKDLFALVKELSDAYKGRRA